MKLFGSMKFKKKSRSKPEKFKQTGPVFNYILEIPTIPRFAEELCDECGGSGIDPEKRISKYRTKYKKKYSKILKTSVPICRKCEGAGKMLWTEKIMGRKSERRK